APSRPAARWRAGAVTLAAAAFAAGGTPDATGVRAAVLVLALALLAVLSWGLLLTTEERLLARTRLAAAFSRAGRRV
ncbi:MAG TPA: hypothetical protein VEQ10_19210, partial [Vicinamibacteria bacterium]|nr:hypothetical protein [Vicinamibacteria bacterium]